MPRLHGQPTLGIDRTGIAVAEGESGGLSADCRCQIHRRTDIFHTVDVATTTSHMRAVCQHPRDSAVGR